MPKTGVDISTYQSGINYDEAKNHIDFAIIRVGYGVQYLPNSQRDKEFDNHYAGFKGKIPLGAYYYAYATSYDTGRKEAENCLAYIGDKEFEMPIYYDLEESRNNSDAARGFVDRIREAGKAVGIYASTSFYKSKGLGDVNCDSVWIAQYGSNTGDIPSSRPSVDFDIWQYTSKGYVEGIGGNVDMNIMEGDTPSPSPSPEPTPSGDDTIRYIQEWCNTYGTNIAVDGYYGPKTKEAIIKVYQTELNNQLGAGLSVDGIFGPKTKSKTPILKPGMEGNITKSVQSMLYCRGYNPNGIDGIYGSGTKNAVTSFQRDHGLSADGLFGPSTASKLFE